jgi:long-chain acyl-CoA synthetase
MPERTIYSLLQQTASRCGDAPALHQPCSEGGRRKYRVTTWNEYLRAAGEIAAGLRALGIRKGDVVGLASETRAEFYLADIGVMTAGAIAAALYPSYPSSELGRLLRDCDSKAVFVEDASTLTRLREAALTPAAAQWILLSGEAEGALSLEALRRLGRDALAAEPGLLARLQQEVGPADTAILYPTSGATGKPKMALVTHGALLANLEMAPQVLDLGPRDSTLAFLSSAHVMQRVVIELLPLACGMPVWFSESLLRLPQELKRIRPTLFVAPPRLWERVHSSIRAELLKRSRLAQRLFEAALELGFEAVRPREAGERPGLARRILPKLAGLLLFARLRRRFGGRLRVCASGSAPLGKELNEFFLAIGLPLIEGYGLTEGGIVILNRPGSPRAGSIGKPLPGVEVRLAEDGELLLRSPTLFAGYHKDPEATARVLRDGWLWTGDIAEMDADGYLSIKGRKKELIALSNGKKIYPTRIEELFRLEPIVGHVVPVGDGKPYLAALVTVNATGAEALEGPDAVAREVHQAIARVNRNLAPFEQIRRFRIVDRDFTVASGELTPTLKVRRAQVLANFRDAVVEMYRD